MNKLLVCSQASNCEQLHAQGASQHGQGHPRHALPLDTQAYFPVQKMQHTQCHLSTGCSPAPAKPSALAPPGTWFGGHARLDPAPHTRATACRACEWSLGQASVFPSSLSSCLNVPGISVSQQPQLRPLSKNVGQRISANQHIIVSASALVFASAPVFADRACRQTCSALYLKAYLWYTLLRQRRQMCSADLDPIAHVVA
eukprot:1160765-Pelagomonas_calceolata.AAC.3